LIQKIDNHNREQAAIAKLKSQKTICSFILALIFLTPPALLVLFHLPEDPKHLAVFPDRVMDYQLKKTHDLFLDDYSGGWFTMRNKDV